MVSARPHMSVACRQLPEQPDDAVRPSGEQWGKEGVPDRRSRLSMRPRRFSRPSIYLALFICQLAGVWGGGGHRLPGPGGPSLTLLAGSASSRPG